MPSLLAEYHCSLAGANTAGQQRQMHVNDLLQDIQDLLIHAM